MTPRGSPSGCGRRRPRHLATASPGQFQVTVVSEIQWKDAELMLTACALLSTLLPDGAVEDRETLLQRVEGEDCRRLLVIALELLEEVLANAVDSPVALELSLRSTALLLCDHPSARDDDAY